MITTEKIWHEYQEKLASFIRTKVAEDTVDDLMQDVGFKPETSIATGIRHFIDWYREYYAVKQG